MPMRRIMKIIMMNRQNNNNADAEDNEDNNEDNNYDNYDNFEAKIINNTINGKNLNENKCENWKLTKNILTADCTNRVSGIPNKTSLKITRDCQPINCIKNNKAKLRCNTCKD